MVGLNKSEHQIAFQITYRLRSGLTIGIGALRKNSAHSKIRESFLGSTGVGMCPSISNLQKFGLDNKLTGSFSIAT